MESIGISSEGIALGYDGPGLRPIRSVFSRMILLVQRRYVASMTAYASD
jgi:hypothetical protein